MMDAISDCVECDKTPSSKSPSPLSFMLSSPSPSPSSSTPTPSSPSSPPSPPSIPSPPSPASIPTPPSPPSPPPLLSYIVNPGKARDIFVSADNVIPVPFTGSRFHFLIKGGAPWTSPTIHQQQQRSNEHWWSSASVFKLNTDNPKSTSLLMSTAYNIRTPIGRTSLSTELNLKSGDWTFETVSQLNDDKLYASLTGQVFAWNEPETIRFDVDYKCSDGTMSMYVDTVLKKFAFQYLHASSCRLSVGVELAFKKCISGLLHYGQNVIALNETVFQPAFMAKYAGAKYLFSGKVNVLEGTTKLAYYRHCNDKLQVGATVMVNPIRSTAISRLAFRVLSDTMLFRAAIGTDGVVSSLWEKQIGNRVSMSVSAFMNHSFSVHGLGIGLSFE